MLLTEMSKKLLPTVLTPAWWKPGKDMLCSRPLPRLPSGPLASKIAVQASAVLRNCWLLRGWPRGRDTASSIVSLGPGRGVAVNTSLRCSATCSATSAAGLVDRKSAIAAAVQVWDLRQLCGCFGRHASCRRNKRTALNSRDREALDYFEGTSGMMLCPRGRLSRLHAPQCTNVPRHASFRYLTLGLRGTQSRPAPIAPIACGPRKQHDESTAGT